MKKDFQAPSFRPGPEGGWRILMFFFLAIGLSLAGPAHEARAATGTVTNNADSGPGSLRSLVLDPTIDVIRFNASVTSIELTSGELFIDRDLTIQPLGDRVTISRDPTAAVFSIFHISTAGISVAFENLNITGGSNVNEGGGIRIENASAVDITNCIIDGNIAGVSGGGIAALYVTGLTVTINSSTISNNTSGNDGGGLYVANDVFVTLDGCTVTGNATTGTTDSNGGGIYNFGYLDVHDSTIDGNLAANYGGGIHNDSSSMNGLIVAGTTISNNTAANGSGGGICNLGFQVKVETCTFSGNSAFGTPGNGGGVYNYYAGSDFNLSYSTVAENHAANLGGGIKNTTGIFNIYQTLIAANTAGVDGPDCYADPATITSYGFNLIEDTQGCSKNNATGDLSEPANLGPLADNGGPNQTHALWSPSGAIDAGDPGLPMDYDQRGVDRPQPIGGRWDIGAFEARRYTLTVTIDGPGQGHVTGQPPGLPDAIDCPDAVCQTEFPETTKVTLTAIVENAPSSYFQGWGGDCAGFAANPEAVVTMDQAASCSATFGLRNGQPTIVSSDPEPDARMVLIDRPLKIVFDQAMNSSSVVTGGAFNLKKIGPPTSPLAAPVPIDGTVTYDESTLTATFTPNGPLEYGQVYEAHVAASMTNIAGINLDHDYIGKFITSGPPVSQALYHPGGSTQGAYIMFTFFLGITNLPALPGGSYDTTLMRIGRWDPLLALYEEWPFPNEDMTDPSDPGMAFWALFRNETTLILEGYDQVLEPGPSSLGGGPGIWYWAEPGWHQVGNPFGHAIKVSQIRISDHTRSQARQVIMYVWNGQGGYTALDAAGSLAPYQGGWIQTQADDEFIFFQKDLSNLAANTVKQPARASEDQPPDPPSGFSSSGLREDGGGGGGGGCFLHPGTSEGEDR